METIADVTARSIAISEKGSVFVASGVEVFRIDPNGILENIAGNEGISAHKDGIGTEARFRSIIHMAIHQNYLYLTDDSTIRRMNIE